MIRQTKSLTAFALAVGSVLCGAPLVGCGVDNGSVFIEGVLPIAKAENCVVDPNGGVFRSESLLDLGDAITANALVLAMRVVTNLPNTFSATDESQSETRAPNYPNYGNSDSNVITFTDAEVFYTTDQDRPGEPALTAAGLQLPGRDDPPLQVGVGGTVYNTQSQLNTGAAIIATVLTQEYAGQLQGATNINRILVNIRLAGHTTGAGGVKTPPFVYPVQLCRGCLVVAEETCPNGTEDTGCVRGVDDPTVCVGP